MKFKTPEDILKPYETEDAEVNAPRTWGVCEAFKSFSERVEFYKRYSFTFNPDKYQDLIQEEQLDTWDKWNKYCSTLKPLPPSIYHYDMWLFDYCFGDMKE